MFFLKKAAVKTTDWLVVGGGIKEDDREIYEYGFDKLYSTLFIFSSAIVFGLLFGMLQLTLVFYLAYFAVRVYAGGIHAETKTRCLIISVGIIIPCLFVISFYQVWYTPIVFYGLLFLSVAVLLWLAPVGSKNKMPDEKEQVVYRRRMIRNLVVLVVVAIALILFSIYNFASAVLTGIVLSAIMTIAGKLKLKIQK